MKSLTAAPSRRNSGLATTGRPGRLGTTTCSQVPGKTVAAVRRPPEVWFGPGTPWRCPAVTRRNWSSPRLLLRSDGVPTQIRAISASATASAVEVVAVRRPAAAFSRTRGSRPGSKKGASPAAHAYDFVLIPVRAEYAMAGGSKAGGGYASDVSQSKYRDLGRFVR